jgi:hypothetical protein
MTTGDEPMLPQPGDDNAPMISGRGTKVIADARGAYIVRNLRGMIARMNAEQRILFRRILITQAVRCSQYIAQGNSADDEVARSLNEAVLKHLESPDQETETAMRRLMRQASSLMNGTDRTRHFALRAALVPANQTTSHSHVGKIAQELAQGTFSIALGLYYVDPVWPHLAQAITSWQIEAAWAILQGKEPRPFEFPT